MIVSTLFSSPKLADEYIIDMAAQSLSHSHARSTFPYPIAGIFMESEETFTIGEKIVLSINFSDSGNPFRIPSTIVCTTSKGIGLKFKFKSQVQEAIITSLIDNLKKTGTKISFLTYHNVVL